MKYKKGLIFICLIICLFSIASVCASDVNETVVAIEDQNELNTFEDINNEVVFVDDCQIITQDDENTINSVNGTLETNENQLVERFSTSSENKLGDSMPSRSDLYNEIKNSNGVLNLTRDYEFLGVDVSININKKITINGNGYSIYLKHNTAAFKITANNVVLNNITFIDGASSSGTVEWVGSKGTMNGCTFVNCRGSAVNWYGNYGMLNSCNFIDSITHSSINSSSKICFSKEGAVYWTGNNGVLNNSNFSNCIVQLNIPRNYNNWNYYGYSGAVYWVGNNGILNNFNMKNCSIRYTFSDKTNTNSIYSYGGAVYWEGLNGLMSNGNFIDCSANSNSIDDAKAYSYGGAVYWNGSYGFVDNCNFFNCVAKSSITYIFSTYEDVDRYFYSYSYGGALYWNGENGTLSRSKFIDCSSNSSFISTYTGDYMYKPSLMSGYNVYYHYYNYRYGYAYGGSVYWEGDDARLLSCDFINSTVDSSIESSYLDKHQADYTKCSNFNYINSYGGAISFSNNKGVFDNSNFINCNANSNYHISYNSYSYLKDFSTYDGSFYSQGGAIYLNNSLINLNKCNFTVNMVHLSSDVPFDIPRPWGYGGAIYWESNFGNISKCNFNNCSVKLESTKSSEAFTSLGGSIYLKGQNCSVIGCNFINSISSAITDSYSYPSAGAIYWNGLNGLVSNCSFINCSTISSTSSSKATTTSYAGAIYWVGANGVVSKNIFVNCSTYSLSTHPTSEGGAIYWSGISGTLNNCIFNDCLAHASNSTSCSLGGSVSWHGQKGNLFNCSFSNSSSASYSYGALSSSAGGAIYWYGAYGVLCNCNFINSSSWYYNYSPYGGAISWGGKYGEIYNCRFINCFSRGVKNSNQKGDGGAINLGGSYQILFNCTFINCSSSTGGAIFYSADNSVIYNCDFENCSANNGGAISFITTNSSVHNCSFLNCSAKYNGGAISPVNSVIYSEGQSNVKIANNIIYNCSFMYCSANKGGAINLNEINDTVYCSSFVNCSAKLGGGAIYWEGYPHRSYSESCISGCNGTVYNCSFRSCSVESNGGAIYWSGKNGTLYNCSFWYCFSESNGTSICWDNIGGYLDDCIFNGEKNTYSEHCYVDNMALFDSNFSIDINNNTVGDCKILINILKTATGNITYYIYNNTNNLLIKSSNISITQDELSISLDDLDYGDYLIVAEYMGDNIYNISSFSAKFNLRYISQFIIDIDPNIEAHDTLTINITLNDDITGNIYLKILNDTYMENVDGGKIYFVIPKIIGGHHEFNIEYNGDFKYNSIQYYGSVDVAFMKSYVDFNVTNFNFNENLILNPSINNTAIGSFNIYLNNKVFATFPVGQTYNLKNLDVGEYNITVEYAGDAYFAPSQKTLNFNVFKAKPSLLLRSTELEIDSVVIEYSITPGVTGKVGVYLNETFIKNVQIGEKINLNDFKLLGFYTIKLVYDGDNHYLSCHNVTNISIKTKDISNDVILNSLDENSLGKSVVIQLPNDAKGTITLNIGGKNYNFNVLDGLANIKVPELVNGKYYYTISYSGDNKYSSFIKTGSLRVNKILPTRLTSVSVSTVYNGNKYLVVTLKDSHGNAISGASLLVNINGVKTINTDANGQARLSTNGLSPKSYNVFIEFVGNSNYQKSSVTVKVTVKKATPKITVKAKTFKKSVKTKKYSITLKDNQNKAMKNTKVTIKINKKTYTAKTNSKGVATFKIKKLTKKGTFKSTVTYKGDKYYNKVTKSVKIKVK